MPPVTCLALRPCLHQVMSTEQALSEALYGNPGVDDSPDAVAAIRDKYSRQLQGLQAAVTEWEDIHADVLVHRSQRLLHCIQTCLEVRLYCTGVSLLRVRQCVPAGPLVCQNDALNPSTRGLTEELNPEPSVHARQVVYFPSCIAVTPQLTQLTLRAHWCRG